MDLEYITPPVITSTLDDGRPIDDQEREQLLSEIDENGVLGSHLDRLQSIFAATAEEVLVALGIAQPTFNKLRRSNDIIEEVPVAILVRLYLEDPQKWPTRYLVPKDVETLSKSSPIIRQLETTLSMAIGRSASAYFRWRENTSGNIGGTRGGVRVALTMLENATKKADQERLKRIIQDEAERRNVNLREDTSWTTNQSAPKD